MIRELPKTEPQDSKVKTLGDLKELALQQIFAISSNFEYRYNRDEPTDEVQDLIRITEIAGAALVEASNATPEAVKPKGDELETVEREYVNYCRLHPSKPIEWTVWHDAAQVGYAEGLKAGKAHAMELRDAFYELIEGSSSALEDMQHYFENKCCPTMDEVNQLAIADSQARIAIAAFDKGGADEA